MLESKIHYQSDPYVLSRYISGLINACFFVFTNVIVGWGTLDAMKQTIPVVIAHNIFDTITGEYWKTDRLMFVHHILAISLCCYGYTIETLTPELYSNVYWFSTAEISSIFNCLRWFFKNTSWQTPLDLTFATSFIIIRPLSVVMTFDGAYNSEDFTILFTCWSVYALLNLYWCCCIFMYSKRIKNSFKKIFGKTITSV